MPGMDGTGALFAPLVDALPASCTHSVLSYPPDPEASYETLTDTVLSALPKEEPFILVAESFSGPLAVLVAQHRPTGLQALVLCATFVTNPTRLARRWMAPFMGPLWFSWTPTYLISRLLLGPTPDPALYEILRDSLSKASPNALAQRAKLVLDIDVEQPLKECPVPILYLRATRDRLVPPHNLKHILTIRPTVRFVDLDSPHLVLQTRPQASIEAIRAFVETL